MRPPILTTRQRELLEFLAAGATRNEIAQHFGISPETVKIHTRAILEKFDAKTVRDAIEYIVAYITAYPIGESDADIYYDEIRYLISVSGNLNTTTYDRHHRVFVLRGTVSEIDSSIDYPGEIFDVLLNGGSPDKTENFGNISNIPKYWIARTVRVTRLNAACITKPKPIAPNIAKRSQIRLARLWVNY